MADEELRALERAWRVTPQDGALATRLVDACRRAGLDAPRDALAMRLLPPRTLRASFPIEVQAWRQGERVETVSSAGGRVVELPQHSTWQAIVDGELHGRQRDWTARDLRELGAEQLCIQGHSVQGWLGPLAGSALETLTIVSTIENDDVLDLDPRPLVHLPRLRELHLVRVLLEPDELAEYGRASRLERLSHSGYDVEAAQVASLPAFPRLAWLSLSNSEIRDSAVDSLAACAALRELELDQSGISSKAVARLRAARPDLAITHAERE